MTDNLPSIQSPSETDTPPAQSVQLEPGFGWTQYAEQLNGRFAMIGFVTLLLMELLTKQDFFTWIGLR